MRIIVFKNYNENCRLVYRSVNSVSLSFLHLMGKAQQLWSYGLMFGKSGVYHHSPKSTLLCSIVHSLWFSDAA